MCGQSEVQALNSAGVLSRTKSFNAGTLSLLHMN